MAPHETNLTVAITRDRSSDAILGESATPRRPPTPRHDAFAELGCTVYGVSTQRPDQQAAFVDFAKLPFRLLSDRDGALASALRLPMFRAAGVDRLKRQSLLLDPDGVVRHVQMPIRDPAASVEEMLMELRRQLDD